MDSVDSIVEVEKVKEIQSQQQNSRENFTASIDYKTILLIIVVIIELVVGIIEGFLMKKCE